MMRIITGKARGVRLATLSGENTRPTSERAKEAVFSMIQFEIQGKEVLDLFSGSGQMGLEALSRGASRAVLCDRSREAVEVIRANAAKTRLLPLCEILCMDFQAVLRNLRRKRSFDLVFLDPPYALGVIPEVLQQLLDGGLLAQNAVIVCETAEERDVFGANATLAESFEVMRGARYGAAFVTLLRLRQDKEAEA